MRALNSLFGCDALCAGGRFDGDHACAATESLAGAVSKDASATAPSCCRCGRTRSRGLQRQRPQIDPGDTDAGDRARLLSGLPTLHSPRDLGCGPSLAAIARRVPDAAASRRAGPQSPCVTATCSCRAASGDASPGARHPVTCNYGSDQVDLATGSRPKPSRDCGDGSERNHRNPPRWDYRRRDVPRERAGAAPAPGFAKRHLLCVTSGMRPPGWAAMHVWVWRISSADTRLCKEKTAASPRGKAAVEYSLQRCLS